MSLLSWGRSRAERLQPHSTSPAPASDSPVDSVLHPTARSEASLSAFYHALALAAHSGTDLTLLHSQGRRSTDSFAGFPTVRGTIAKWRAYGMARSIERKLKRWQVIKLEVESRDPVAASMEHVFRHKTGFIVIATEGPDGSTRLVQPSRAARLARLSGRVSLFVPHGCRPFVSGATGEVWLRRILVPIDGDTDPRPAVLHALRSVALVDDPALEITLLQLGKDDPPFLTDLPDLPFCKWASVRRSGEPAAQILGLAQEVRTDAIYMPTALGWPAPASPYRGLTEAVIQGAKCPVATIPVEQIQPRKTRYRQVGARSGRHAA